MIERIYSLTDGNQNSPHYTCMYNQKFNKITKTVTYMYEKLGFLSEITIPNQILEYFQFQELPIVSCVLLMNTVGVALSSTNFNHKSLCCNTVKPMNNGHKF